MTDPINPGAVMATVNDSKGAALVGADVTATGTGVTRGTNGSGTTKADGKVTISLAPGTYSVVASKSGFNTSPAQTSQVSSDKTNDLTFTLTATS